MYEPNLLESFNLGKITQSFLGVWINQNNALNYIEYQPPCLY